MNLFTKLSNNGIKSTETLSRFSVWPAFDSILVLTFYSIQNLSKRNICYFCILFASIKSKFASFLLRYLNGQYFCFSIFVSLFFGIFIEWKKLIILKSFVLFWRCISIVKHFVSTMKLINIWWKLLRFPKEFASEYCYWKC